MAESASAVHCGTALPEPQTADVEELADAGNHDPVGRKAQVRSVAEQRGVSHPPEQRQQLLQVFPVVRALPLRPWPVAPRRSRAQKRRGVETLAGLGRVGVIVVAVHLFGGADGVHGCEDLDALALQRFGQGALYGNRKGRVATELHAEGAVFPVRNDHRRHRQPLVSQRAVPYGNTIAARGLDFTDQRPETVFFQLLRRDLGRREPLPQNTGLGMALEDLGKALHQRLLHAVARTHPVGAAEEDQNAGGDPDDAGTLRLREGDRGQDAVVPAVELFRHHAQKDALLQRGVKPQRLINIRQEGVLLGEKLRDAHVPLVRKQRDRGIGARIRIEVPALQKVVLDSFHHLREGAGLCIALVRPFAVGAEGVHRVEI